MLPTTTLNEHISKEATIGPVASSMHKSVPQWIMAVVVGVMLTLGSAACGQQASTATTTVPARTATPTPRVLTATPTIATVPPTPTALLSHWESGVSMSIARQGLAAVEGPDGRIYVLGGFNSRISIGNSALDMVEVYDPKTNTWSSVASMPTPREDLAAVVGPDGRIYALGGSNGPSRALTTVEAYDPSTNTWSSVAPMLTPRFALAAVAGPDGRIYALGGLNSQGVILNTMEAYDPSTNTWSPVAPMPTARAGLAAVLGPDGRIYALGGAGSSGSALDTVEAYDPRTNTWSSIAPMLTPRVALAAVLGPDGRIYALGGAASANGSLSTVEMYNTVEVYNPTVNTWSFVPSMSTPRSYFAAVAGADGRIYALGGAASANGPLGTVEIGYGNDWGG